LQELASAAGEEFHLEEEQLPVATAVATACEILGFEPLHLANEGRFLAAVPAEDQALAEELFATHGGRWIGEVRSGVARVVLRTRFGSERLLVPPSGELLPRIC
jgi:hydrogenase expression/formation protein HypE